MNEKEIQAKMRKAALKISICMGVTISFFLSLTGTLSSGHFTLPGWIVSFLVSTVISLIIGFLVPMHKISQGAARKRGLVPGSMAARVCETLISDLIYTPVITLCMTFLGWRQASAHAPVSIPFLPMFLKSLVICFLVGFVMIFLFQPLYMKIFVGDPPRRG